MFFCFCFLFYLLSFVTWDLDARGFLRLKVRVGTKELNEALIFGVAIVFFVSFFDSEVQEVAPPMQKEPHDVGRHDTRRYEENITFNSILLLILWEGILLLHSIRSGENTEGGKLGFWVSWDIMDLAWQSRDGL